MPSPAVYKPRDRLIISSNHSHMDSDEENDHMFNAPNGMLLLTWILFLPLL